MSGNPYDVTRGFPAIFAGKISALDILLQSQKCLYVCLFPISSAIYRPIGTKLGRKVGDGFRKHLAWPVSMETNALPWQQNGDFYGQITIVVGYKVTYEVMDDVTSPMTSLPLTSP